MSIEGAAMTPSESESERLDDQSRRIFRDSLSDSPSFKALSMSEQDAKIEDMLADKKALNAKWDAFDRTAPPVEVICRIYRRKGVAGSGGGPRFVIKAHPSYLDDLFAWPEVTGGEDHIGGPRDGQQTRVLRPGRYGDSPDILFEFDPSMPPQPDDDPGVYREPR